MSNAAAAAASSSSGITAGTMKPVGGVASLLRAEDEAAAAAALGCVANVYASAEKMDAAYMQGDEARDALLVNDTLPVGPSLRLVPAAGSSSATAGPPAPEPIYRYPNDPYMSTSYPYWPMPPPGAAPHVRYPPPPPSAPAPPQRPANRSVGLLPPLYDDAGGGLGGLLPPTLYRCHACYALGSTMGNRGFVQGVATYTVMDDLTVTPGSNMSTVALLGRIGIKDLAAVEEKTVTVGRKECLEIIRVSLRSKTVLTDVFLDKTKKRARTAGDNNDDEAE